MALHANLVADLTEALSGWSVPVCWGVGVDRGVCVVASRKRSRLFGSSNEYLVAFTAGGELRALVVHESVSVELVQPHPQGFLLVGATPGVPGRDAIVISRRGDVLARFSLGRGVADVRVAHETLWVSYGDEGALATSGLVGLSLRGEPRFEFDAEAAGTGNILDVYAMNVTATGDVWLSYYTEFPIVRIRNGLYDCWHYSVGAADALAVSDERVLLYDERARRACIVELRTNGTTGTTDEHEVMDDRGLAVYGELPVHGVGPELFFWRAGRVFTLSDW